MAHDSRDVLRSTHLPRNVQAVKATASGLDPEVEADNVQTITTTKYELFVMSSMKCYPKLRERGQVTIPEEVRNGLNLEEGDQLELTVEKLE